MTKGKSQQKSKVKVAVKERFSVLPLVEKGDEFLCVDAKNNFLVISKKSLELYPTFALPETFDAKSSKKIFTF